ncbi:MAG TPA: AAA family ATPase [bacterium]
MKLNSIALSDYGPVKEFSFRPGGFDLIYGANETGKTAIVEALSYALFGRDVRGLRYGKPQTIAIEGESSQKKFRLPSKKTDPIMLKGEITNLLYVQASETSLYKEETGSRFWDSVKLIMSKVGQKIPFSRLGEKVLENAGMTAKGRWKESRQKIINDEAERIKKLEEFLRELEKIEQMKLQYAKKNAEYEKLAREIDAMKSASKYYDFKKLSDLYVRYQDKKNELAGYKRYEQKYYDEWQKLEAERAAKSSVTQRLKDDERMLGDLQKQLDTLARTEQIIGDLDLRSYIAGTGRLPRQPSMFYALLAFLLGMAVLFLKFKFGFSIIWPVVVIALSLALFFKYQFDQFRVRRFQISEEAWLNKAKAVFPDLKTLAELRSRLETAERERVRCETLLAEKKQTREEIGSAGTLQALEERIDELRSITGLAELEQLKEKVRSGAQLKAGLEGIKVSIESLLHNREESAWKRLIDEKKCDPPEIPVDEARFDEKIAAFEKLKTSIDAAKQQIAVFEESRYKVYNVNDAGQALQELRRLKRDLDNGELEQRAALKAFEILNEMSGELDDFIDEIMAAGDSNVSRYFARVTEKYKQVKVVEREFVVVREDGREFSAGSLSSGAQDQLLLCFRMAAIKKLFPDGCFLILDDAFIFADWQRRRRLAELVREFSQQGNQVIYLTSDDHTRDSFKEFGAKVTEIS